ncbi:hypothetical protein ACIP5U_39405 [Streptomyces sp. NPDC088788]|uniref:hypothetical protein n=1 Tax=Streptomyces sp. NPDC088788 TaxID=3365898 RepID=UPI0037FBD0E0
MATLVHLRHDVPHAVLVLLYGVDRSTITRADGEILACLPSGGRGPGPARRTTEQASGDLFANAEAEGAGLRLDALEILVRRPVAGRGGRRALCRERTDGTR